jgi:beta propeller repeat protein
MKSFRPILAMMVLILFLRDVSWAQEIQITSNPANQYNPQIYDHRIVWMDERNGNRDIYLYDLQTAHEIPIATSSAQQWYPAIYEDKIVYLSSWQIYLYDLAKGTEQRVTPDGSIPNAPLIFGNRVIWGDMRNYNFYYCDPFSYEPDDLYVFDLLLIRA